MNEPKQSSNAVWIPIVNAAIAAIRAAGCLQPVQVPMISGTNTNAFMDHARSGLPLVIDNANNWHVDVHQYYDTNLSGTGTEVRGRNFMRNILQPITSVARQLGVQLFLGEFGAGNNNQAALDCLRHGLNFLNQNGDVWIGWAQWGAGDNWSSSYPILLQGPNFTDTPQSLNVRPYYKGGSKRKPSKSVTTSNAYPVTSTGAVFSVDATTSRNVLSAGMLWSRDGDWWGPAFKSNPQTIDIMVRVPSGYTNASNKFLASNFSMQVGLNTTGQLRVQYGSANYTQTGNIADGLFHHVRVTYSPSYGSTLFVDGVLVGSSTVKGDTANPPGLGTIAVGGWNQSGSDSAIDAGCVLDWAAFYCQDFGRANFVPPEMPPRPYDKYLAVVYPLDGNSNNYALGE